MPDFQYTALTTHGSETTGVENAKNKQQLVQQLKFKRLILLKAKRIRKKAISFALSLRLATELTDLVSGGIKLERALQILGDDTEDKHFNLLCNQIRQGLKDGLSLSQALDRCGTFDPLFIPLINAGEASGKLAQALNILEQYYLNKKQFRSELNASLAYPAILIFVSIVSVIALTVYVIPIFKDIFADDMQALPLGTRFCFAASDWMAANGAAFGAVIGLIFTLCWAAIQYSETIRLNWHRLQLKLPLFGRLISQNEAAKTFNVLGVLLNSGVPLLQALDISQAVIMNMAQRNGMTTCIQKLKQGGTLSANLYHIPDLPVIASRLIKVGDESGNLAASCDKTAQIIQRNLKSQLKSLVTLIEPLVILFMGGVIGFVIISMLLAIFSMSDLV